MLKFTIRQGEVPKAQRAPSPSHCSLVIQKLVSLTHPKSCKGNYVILFNVPGLWDLVLLWSWNVCGPGPCSMEDCLSLMDDANADPRSFSKHKLWLQWWYQLVSSLLWQCLTTQLKEWIYSGSWFEGFQPLVHWLPYYGRASWWSQVLTPWLLGSREVLTGRDTDKTNPPEASPMLLCPLAWSYL